MKRSIAPGCRFGRVRVPSSKSQAHRLLICAALGREPVQLLCDGISRDIQATIDCLVSLGAEVDASKTGEIRVKPIEKIPDGCCILPCGESGSTLRFLLPLVGALGAEAVFQMEGRLPLRPLLPLDEQLRARGMQIRQEGDRLFCSGQLRPGDYVLPGNISSQYISGLLMALPILRADSSLVVEGKLESASYVEMTRQVLNMSGLRLEENVGIYRIPGNQRAKLPSSVQVESDYSSAAFFLCMGALSQQGIWVEGLSPDTVQGDKAILKLLRDFGAELIQEENGILARRGSLRAIIIDAAPIPDLIPVLCVVAAVAQGETQVVNAARLRLKESDRLRSTAQLLEGLGARVEEREDGLRISGQPHLRGGLADSCGDHRIAMSAAVAACVCDQAVSVLGAECVEKSYPRFWEDFEQLTGGEP